MQRRYNMEFVRFMGESLPHEIFIRPVYKGKEGKKGNSVLSEVPL